MNMFGSVRRITHLPPHLQCLVYARLCYSTASSSQYAFPRHSRPTPHEIFHLSRGASQADIKRRYIELVKLHHPDSQSCRDLPPHERHRRFQMISSAYDALRHNKELFPDRDRTLWEEIDRRKRAQAAYYKRHSRRAEYEYAEWKNPNPVDARWTDRIILTFGFVSLVAGLIPMVLYPRHPVDRLQSSSGFHISEARREARLKYEDRLREFEASNGPGSKGK
ncbi:J domain-containing protein [Mycena sanguinolenta]|uniref:J domain-containing protein n=1 Tax=Mycena sanguinolenta TaxID=230812 RepID=A0A8H7DFH7_9AGAR|nr:J domain-containing protein [Mycena sanguinolenta]